MGLYWAPQGVTNGTINLTLPFTGNQFNNTGAILPNYPSMANNANQPTTTPTNQIPASRRTWAGMHLDALSSMTVGSCTFNGVSNGIIMASGNLNVSGTTFSNISANGYTYDPNQGIGINCSSNYVNLSTGGVVHSLTQTGLGSLTTAPATFNNCSRGIYCVKVNADISENLFSGTTDIGIQVINSKLANIKIGYVTNPLTPATNNRGNRMTSVTQKGISLLNNDPVNNLEVQYNDITVNGVSGSVTGYGIEVAEQMNAAAGYEYYHHNKITLNNFGSFGMHFTTCKGNPSAHTLYRFDVYSNTILMNNPTRNFTGIALNSCELTKCYLNLINSTNAGTQNSVVAGYPVAYYYNGTINSHYSCNQNNTVYNGVKFSGTNTGINLYTHEFGNSAIANTTLNNTIGLLIENNATLPPQPHAGNKWYGTYPVNAAAVNNSASFGGQRFDVNSSAAPLFPSRWNGSAYVAAVTPTSGWFFPSSGTTTTCNYSPLVYGASYKTDEDSPEDSLDALDILVIADSLQFTEFEDPLKWQNEKNVYEKLKNNTGLMEAGSEVETFYLSKQASPTGSLSAVEENKQSALLPDTLLASQIAGLNNLKDSLTRVSIANDATIDSSSTGQQIEVWKISSDNLQAAIAAVNTQLSTQLQNYNTIRLPGVEQANAQNMAITTNQQIENNFKLLNNIYLNTVAKDTITFNANQLADLYYLAFQCPLAGGAAVHRARSLLTLVVDTFYNDKEICAAQGIFFKKENSTALAKLNASDIKFSLMPNPARDFIILQASENIMEQLQLYVTDYTGRQVIAEIIRLDNKRYRLPVSYLSSGLYFIKIQNALGGLLYSSKFNVIN